MSIMGIRGQGSGGTYASRSALPHLYSKIKQALVAQKCLKFLLTSGAVFVFRDRRGDRIKLLHWNGQGFCLYYKILERGRFF